MSDSINYDELDKAVTAAITARAEAKEKSRPSSARPAPAAKKPVEPRGYYMDFAPRYQQVSLHTVTQTTIIKPAAKAPETVRPARVNARVVDPMMISKPAPVRSTAPRVAINPAAKAAHFAVAPARPVAKPVAKPVASRPVAAAPVRPVAAARPAARPVARPMQRPAVLRRPVAAPRPNPAAITEEELIIEEEEIPILAKPKAKKTAKEPNANNYSLGGRSPFLNPDAKVEKRPLGLHIPESSALNLSSTHNVYSQKSPLKNNEYTGKHIITEAPQKKNGWLWTIIVIGIIAAGGALGYLAYLLVFAK